MGGTAYGWCHNWWSPPALLQHSTSWPWSPLSFFPSLPLLSFHVGLPADAAATLQQQLKNGCQRCTEHVVSNQCTTVGSYPTGIKWEIGLVLKIPSFVRMLLKWMFNITLSRNVMEAIRRRPVTINNAYMNWGRTKNDNGSRIGHFCCIMISCCWLKAKVNWWLTQAYSEVGDIDLGANDCSDIFIIPGY